MSKKLSLKELSNGNYFIYQIDDGGCGIVYAENGPEEAATKVLESYVNHGCEDMSIEEISIYDIYEKPFDDSPDVIEIGLMIEIVY